MAHPEDPPPSVQVYLLHGTWGRGLRPGKTPFGRPQTRPIWSEPGGHFHDDLRDALRAQGIRASLQTINWSGSNSVLERDHVAKFLAQRLDEDAGRMPGAAQVVIAHSHGGNIALDAARHHRTGQGRLHIVTLATPFIDLWMAVAEHDADGRYSEAFGRAAQAREGLTRMRFATCSLAATGGAIWAGSAAGWLPPIAALLAHPNIWLLMAFPTVLMVVTLALTGRGVLTDRLMRVQRLESPAQPGLAQCRLLVLRGTDDEAGLALAAGSIQAILGSSVTRISAVVLSLAGTFILALTRLPGGLLHAAIGGIAVAVVLFLLGSLLETVGRAAAGREFIFAGPLLGISINSAPDFAGDVTITTLAGSPSTGVMRGEDGRAWGFNSFARDYRFRHGLYAHRDCVPAIIAWLKPRLSP